MKRLLCFICLALTLPNSIKAQWFLDKTFHLRCEKTHHKMSMDGRTDWSDWIPIEVNHFENYTLNEKEKTAYLYIPERLDNLQEEYEELNVKETIKSASN